MDAKLNELRDKASAIFDTFAAERDKVARWEAQGYRNNPALKAAQVRRDDLEREYLAARKAISDYRATLPEMVRM